MRELFQSKNVAHKRRPLGVYLFTAVYSLVALIGLFGTLAFVPEAHANADFINPWDTALGPTVTLASLVLLVSSFAAFRGSRPGRMCLTASLGIILAGAFILEVWEFSQLRGIQGCFSRPSCALLEWWALGGASPFWILCLVWFAFHCWYFFGSRTRHFYFTSQNA